jgi:hypothetical protein
LNEEFDDILEQIYRNVLAKITDVNVEDVIVKKKVDNVRVYTTIDNIVSKEKAIDVKTIIDHVDQNSMAFQSIPKEIFGDFSIEKSYIF